MSVCLIIWAAINIVLGFLIFAIPALIFSIMYAIGDDDKYKLALTFNILSTVIGIAMWIAIIIIVTS
jgi:hypothetical protein